MNNYLGFGSKNRGVLQLESLEYGRSVLGTSLRYFPCCGKCELLVMAGIHGEEPETTFLLSRALRAFNGNFEKIAFVLCANPDGMVLGTRGNANGVDLNRNFPTDDWNHEKVWSRSILESQRDTELSPGYAPASECETVALIRLVETLNPESVIAIHAPMGCIDAPQKTVIVEKLQEFLMLPWISDVGYKTPGSFGTWCGNRGLDCVTLELPRLAPELLFERYGVALARLLNSLDS